MCGIVAHFALNPEAGLPFVTDEALGRLSHRGPDGVGQARVGRAIVAHTRLAIVDVHGGLQPIRGEDGRVVVVCNGEIYNHHLLRERLTPTHAFRTRNDCEVVVHLYEDLRADCVSKLDGMFAFFATDGTGFTAARDPLGIKPLYVGRDRLQGLWFASEFKALPRHCESFSALPPGSRISESGAIQRWYRPRWSERVGDERSFCSTELLSLLEKAVVKRLMSDVPLGVFLSGGLDSSLVAAIASRHVAGLKTFAVGCSDAPDLAPADLVARRLGTDHYQRIYSADEMIGELENVIYHLESYDPALVHSAIPCYFLSELASQHVKVALTGEGADELFAGYSYLRHIRNAKALHAECARLLLGLHAMNLQRVDRMTMAHGLEGRVPFLDVEFVDWAMRFDPRLKLHGPGLPDKRLLRAAAERLLPREIVIRPKLEFAQGAGADPSLRDFAERRISDRDLRGARKRFPIDTPDTKEELLYRNIFDNLFPGESARSTVAKWSPWH